MSEFLIVQSHQFDKIHSEAAAVADLVSGLAGMGLEPKPPGWEVTSPNTSHNVFELDRFVVVAIYCYYCYSNLWSKDSGNRHDNYDVVGRTGEQVK